MQTLVMSQGEKQPPQAVAGLVPPQLGEALIRQAWPSVTDTNVAAAPALIKKLQYTIVLAPLGWLLAAPLYFKKVLPFLAKRYVLTNRRLMVRRGWKGKPAQEIALGDIDDVRLDESTFDPFYRSGTLEVISGGKVALRLRGVPEPESFRRAILNAALAWAPKKR
ncbi:MAG TPA: PH domain-containing protein [Gemmataceae bacterium]|nr:PH domain-containing protein [Gemmataceae bacterium]